MLLDTCVVSYIARDDDRAGPFKRLIYGHYQVISFVTVGEVLKGAIKAKMAPANVAKLETQLSLYEVIAGTATVARTYGRVRAALEKAGAACEDNDVWIASCALAQPVRLPVVTRDSDFDRIAAVLPELVVVRPG